MPSNLAESETLLSTFCREQSVVAAHAQMALGCALGVPDQRQEALLVASTFSVVLRLSAALEQHLNLVASDMMLASDAVIEKG